MTELSVKKSNVSDPQGVGTGPPNLAPRDVHIWLSPRQLLPNSDTFKRTVLSRYADIAPAALQFGTGTHGKPYLLDAVPALDFNLSHSGDWLVCAVTAGTRVGIDIEDCNTPQRKVMTLARRFFCTEEAAAMAACSSAAQRDLFYDLWTLKESAVKAMGYALATGLTSRRFNVQGLDSAASGQGRIAVTAARDTGPAYYALLAPQPGYRLALCWLPQSPVPPQITAFELSAGGVTTVRDIALRASSWQD